VASRAQITRLEQRIEELAESAASRPRKVVRITQEEGETEDDAVNKYFAQHPEDVGSDIILSVYV
jgi:predicted metalloprotease with PDZ domain